MFFFVALFTVITFPFLFSVMFGDAGDAIIYIIFAGLLIAMEKKLMLRNNKDVSLNGIENTRSATASESCDKVHFSATYPI